MRGRVFARGNTDLNLLRPNLIYLHGFASGPTSRKAQYFRERFAAEGISIEIPDLAAGDFEHLTISGQLKVIESVANGKPVSLIGSSLGGYLAALYASRHPEVAKVVLLAPAFHFLRNWTEKLGLERAEAWKRTGSLPVYHYGDKTERHLDYAIVTDGQQYEPAPTFRQPALIFHGTNDDVVPARFSEGYAASHSNVKLRLLDSSHELTDVLETMWEDVRRFGVAIR